MQSKSMKVFLRNTQTGWYYQEPSKWTPDQEEALDLAQVARAVERIFEAHLENVEILLCYDDPRYDLDPACSPIALPGMILPRQRQASRESRPEEKGKSATPGKKGAPL